jgi:hypothetical protein
MAIVKVNGLTIGIVKVSEVNVKELEKAGFSVEVR